MSDAPPLPLWVRATDRLSDGLAILGALALILLAGNVFLDVVGRTIFRHPFGGTLEYTAYWWMPTLTLLAFGYTEKQQEHIKVTILLDVLPMGLRRGIEMAFGLLTLGMTAALCYYATLEALQSMALGRTTPSTPPVPIWPFKFMATLGLAVLTLQLLASCWRWASGHYGSVRPTTEAV